MLILGIDTTTKYTAVAVSENGKVLSHKEAELGRAQSDLLPQFVQEALTGSNKTLQEIDYICAANGPGYYTGIRTGIAFAAALAMATDKKVVPVSTLETLVFDLRNKDGLYVPILKARSDSVYIAIYKAENSKLIEFFAPNYMTATELAEKLKDLPEAVLVGADAKLYSELAILPNTRIDRDIAPSGQIAIIAEKYADCAAMPQEISGNYLREPDIGATR